MGVAPEGGSRGQSLLIMCAFWHEMGMDLMVASLKLCWEPTPRALYRQRESSPKAHIITYLDEVAIRVPSLDAWDQLVWPTTASIQHALTEAELYGYCRGQAVDLGTVLPVVQYWITEEEGAYVCSARALVFEGSVLVYNPAMNEAEWVPVCGLANDLSWAEERSAVALANYVPCIPVGVAQITRLEASQIVSCPGEDSTSEEKEAQHPDLPTTHTDPKQEDETEARQTDPEEEAEPNRWQCPQDWEAIMEGAKGLAYDDPQSDSDGDGWPAGACIILV